MYYGRYVATNLGPAPARLLVNAGDDITNLGAYQYQRPVVVHCPGHGWRGNLVQMVQMTCLPGACWLVRQRGPNDGARGLCSRHRLIDLLGNATVPRSGAETPLGGGRRDSCLATRRGRNANNSQELHAPKWIPEVDTHRGHHIAAVRPTTYPTTRQTGT